MTRNQSELPPDRISPSELMRARRPELFSDSREHDAPTLTREAFEYHLDTLTSRKEETKFEHFVRKLAEREICPNLLPQTGPTGGGDSKVDTETYPVSEAIAERWYVGVDQSAAQERWAFAISAKEDWSSKLKSDVKKIARTGRDYKRIFFITNQFVPDKKRAQSEDELSKEYGVPVSVLDRSWIVDKVFGNDRVALAVDALGLTSSSTKRDVVGPNDARRTEELLQLDAQIEDQARYAGVEYQLAEDCLEAALLARGLEHARSEVEGRLHRASRIAAKVGDERQQLRIYYQTAWTVFWWYDDYEQFDSLYDEVEKAAEGGDQADDLELLANLWHLLYPTVLRGALDRTRSKVEQRTEKLKAELDRLAKNENRPTNALRARTTRLLVELSETVNHRRSPDDALKALKGVVAAAKGLVNYPIDQLNDVVRELGDVLADNDFYDELFEALTNVIEARRGEGTAGGAFLHRGYQKLKAELPFEAIRFFGRAQEKLAKREYRGELVASLVGCGFAYEDAGLLWAAWASMLAAASHALNEFWERGTIVRPAFRAVQKLIWLELRLGRVPMVLAWIELADVLMRHLEASFGRDEQLYEERHMQDMVFGLLLACSDLSQLRELDFFPELLVRGDLVHAHMVLLFALGHETRLRDDGWIPADEASEKVQQLFERMLDQPARRDLPERPDLLSGPRVTLRSRVLGCDVAIEAPNEPASIHLAEAIAGALEAFLATSLNLGIFPHRENFLISIDQGRDPLHLPRYEVAQDEPKFRVFHSTPICAPTIEAQRQFLDWLQELVVRVITEMAMIRDLESYMEQVAGSEKAFARALHSAHVDIYMGNVLGQNPKLRIADWQKGFEGERFELTRKIPWTTRVPKFERSAGPRRRPTPASGEPPPGLFDLERGTHADIKIRSLIDVRAWDAAQWRATAYAGYDPGWPPILLLGFLDKEAGERIFKNLRNRLGKVDEKEELRISIITEIDHAHPSAYRVVVGSNLDLEVEAEGGMIVQAARINSMYPRDSKNLERFLADVKREGRYVVAPMHFVDEHTPFAIPRDFWIGKRQLVVRPMWEIGENDLDLVAIQPDDNPIIPEGHEDAPILRALARVRKHRG